jgi:electron transfer flavoprotein alpha subunit
MTGRQGMTVYCLVELDAVSGGPAAGGSLAVADASLRALTLSRGLASGSELSRPASRSAPMVAAVVFADAASIPVADLAAYGVTDIYAVSVDGYAPQAWARAIAGLLHSPAGSCADTGAIAPVSAHDHEFSAVLAAGTDHGNEVLAHLGAITGLPMAANCVEASAPAESGHLDLVRQRWAGLLLEEAVLDARAALLTVATDAVPPVPASEPATVTVHEVRPSLEDADLVVRAAEAPAGAGGASLATARVVVGGGRGVGSADGFAALEELAELLGGVVGVSRVVTSEGWRPHTQQVGQTGTKITPNLYLACGISGAIQHIAGCSGAKHIIAINTDPAAPMMSRADYAIVGDLHQVIPALIAALRCR